MNVLLDTNVLLDVLLQRSPWFAESSQVWDAHMDGRIRGHVAAFTLPTIFYVVRRQSDFTRALTAVRVCLATFEILQTSRSTLELAALQTFNDFEDNLQAASAIEGKLQAIITRDLNGFPQNFVTLLTPTQLLAAIR